MSGGSGISANKASDASISGCLSEPGDGDSTGQRLRLGRAFPHEPDRDDDQNDAKDPPRLATTS